MLTCVEDVRVFCGVVGNQSSSSLFGLDSSLVQLSSVC
jgi:hypothetical protein